MSYVFHPAAEAEHLESVAYTSSRKGLGSVLRIWRSLRRLWGRYVSRLNGIRLKENLMCGAFEWIGSRIRYFIVKHQKLFKYWQLLIIVGVHNIGWVGSNTVLHPTLTATRLAAGELGY